MADTYIPVSPTAGIDLSAAPGADLSLDALFGNPEVTTVQPTSDTPATPPNPAPQVLETPISDIFLKTPTGTVYKTQEEAVRGLSHKDEVIENLRAQLSERTGIDPITGKAVASRTPQTPQATSPEQFNYATDPVKYWNDLSDAVEKKDPTAYQKVSQKFLNDSFAPIAPILRDVAVQRALDNVSRDIPDFKDVHASPEYSAMLNDLPLLKQSIETGESYLEATPQLPELYKYAYLIYQGRKAREIASSPQLTPATPAITQPSRPTLTPSTPNAPAPAPPPNMATSEGRKAIIAAAEGRGIQDSMWSQLKF